MTNNNIIIYRWNAKCLSDKVGKNIVFCHLLDLQDFFKSNSGDSCVLVSEGADFGLHHEGGKYVVRTLNTTNVVFDEIPPNIKKWYSTNMMIREPFTECLPLGVPDDSLMMDFKDREIPRDKLIYMNFSIQTNIHRYNIYNHFMNKKWVDVGYNLQDKRSCVDYYSNIKSHKFVICPPGHGVDTYRMWESLYLGAIPVVQKSILTSYFRDLPILEVEDWRELTVNSLERSYNEITRGKYNMDKLKESYWINRMKDE